MDVTPDDVRRMLWPKLQGRKMRPWCREHDVTVSHLSEFLRGVRLDPPGDVLRALNLEYRIVRKRRQP